MTSSAPASLNVAMLFTWHMPSPGELIGGGRAAWRKVAQEQALANVPGGSPEHRAVETITSAREASAAEIFALARELENDLDPIVYAALLHAYALCVLDTNLRGSRGRRAAQASAGDARDAVLEALNIIETEAKYLAEAQKTAPSDLLPAEMKAALTSTFVRAALANSDPSLALDALPALENHAQYVTEPRVKMAVLIDAGIGYLAAGNPDAAVLPATRARSIARLERDVYSEWKCARVRAFAATAKRRRNAEHAAHGEVARLARTIADGLETPQALQIEAGMSELESRSVLLRYFQAIGQDSGSEDQASAILVRTARIKSAEPARAAKLWPYEVEASFARVSASRKALLESLGAETISRDLPREYESRRQDARSAVAAAPADEREQALQWSALLDQSHAEVLHLSGKKNRALRVYERVLDNWRTLGDHEAAKRCEKSIAAIKGK